MEGTVIAINKLTSADNAAAVGGRIEDLIAAKYSGPDWLREGPNYVRNGVTGEVVNVNQEAVSLLQSEGPRNDAVAVVATPEGTHESVFIHEDAVKAAGGDLRLLAANLQKVLSEGAAGPGIPAWVYVAGGVGILFLVMRRGSGGKARRK